MGGQSAEKRLPGLVWYEKNLPLKGMTQRMTSTDKPLLLKGGKGLNVRIVCVYSFSGLAKIITKYFFLLKTVYCGDF